ncbi:MAG: DUF177 domain-containing protein [Oscillospiraceae bacterium]|nr:DUF177 domain-containing protein [Oscillospiraceae bacterium]
MLLDLRGIVSVPGGRVEFDYEPDMSGAPFGSIIRIKESPRAVGNVTNSAGVLTFFADLDAICVCVCARCLCEFEYPVHKKIKAYLNDGEQGQNPDGYTLRGDMADADEIIVTEFILSMDDRLLCRSECAGLCQSCGSDLNYGPCSCEKQPDPRLAVLAQLVDVEL